MIQDQWHSADLRSHSILVISISIFQSDAERYGEVQSVLSAVALYVAAVVEEIL